MELQKKAWLSVIGGGLLLAGQAAQALIIDASDYTVDPNGGACLSGSLDCWTSNVNSQPDALTIQGLTGETDLLFGVYKAEVGNATDSGSAASWYDTTFSDTPTDPSAALIKWLSGDYLSADNVYLSVKDGNQNPALYVFDISVWNGTDDIKLLNFWPSQGAISNVAIWASDSGGTPPTGVPEPNTILLLGLGLAGLGAVRRRRQ